MKGRAAWACVVGGWLLGVGALPLASQAQGPMGKPAELKIVEIKEPGGQILSYRHDTGSTEVTMRGTKLAPEARIKLKVQSRPGFVEIDINRGAITGLKPARRLGKDFLTYVFWAVSVDGRAENLGEITFAGESPVSINVTTSYQTFWLMVTAEPDYAVVDPSPNVILYSASGERTGKKAPAVGGVLFFYTHYTGYDSAPGPAGDAPNELLQARKAVELASKSGILAAEHRGGAAGSKEEQHARETLQQAEAFLAEAEAAHQSNPGGSDVIQLARTAAQIAENARALAQGAVGGASNRQLENELAKLRAELARRPKQGPPAPAEPPPAPVEPPPVEPPAAEPPPSIVKNPVTWFGLIGWGLALLLLLRRRST